jgi:hypothetical protein
MPRRMPLILALPLIGRDQSMRLRTRFIAPAVIAAAAVFGFAAPAMAGSPHFVGTPTFTTSGSTVTVSAKEAGLGDEAQIHVVLTGDALCINNGGNHPKAVNKASVAAAADVPVQNGKSEYTLTATAAFQPACSPPMTVEFQNLKLTDETNGLTAFPVPAS